MPSQHLWRLPWLCGSDPWSLHSHGPSQPLTAVLQVRETRAREMKSKTAQPAHRGSSTQIPTSLLSPKLSQPTAHLPGMEAFGLDSTQKCGVLMLDPRVECVDRSPSKKQNSERVGIQGAETWRRVLWACGEVKTRRETAEALTGSRSVACRTTASVTRLETFTETKQGLSEE